ncbi:MAG: anthranilate synthase component I [Eubacterium sp.]
MINPSFDEIKDTDPSYKVIPISKEIFADVITPISLLRRLEKNNKNFFLLESVEGGEKWGRYSFLGYNPVMSISCKNNEVHIRTDSGTNKVDKDPMDVIREVLAKYKSKKIPGLPSFTGGFVGYFSYEMIKYAEPKLNIKKNDFDDYNLMLFDKVIAYDHLKQKIIVIVNMKVSEGKSGYEKAVNSINEIVSLINDQSPLPVSVAQDKVSFTCNTTKERYCEMVEKTKQYIYEGDIFQGVISRKFKADYGSSLINAYRILRTTNPSPYMFFLQSGNIQIAGASPETMVKLLDGRLTTFPVAGTRHRGKTEAEDIEIEKSLMSDMKELSEHNMLVDLGRNDIGKITKYGSVIVKDYMSVHRFSKVMHIASTVEGDIRDDKDGCDAINALLPAGTLSGAPKFRACEIIDELEAESRGIYGGGIGYLDFTGNLDVCIAIRTAVKRDNEVYVQAGAGIVADSIPENEYQECANKASAVIDAIKRASEVNG